MSKAPDGYKGEWDGLPQDLQQLVRRIYVVSEAVENETASPDMVFEFFDLQDEVGHLLFWEEAKLTARKRP